MDEIWLVVRKDGQDMHRTSYNGRSIRAYKTEGMAKGQAKRWNKPYKVVDQYSYVDPETMKWVPTTYKMVDPDELYVVVKYVPELTGDTNGTVVGQATETPTG